MSSPANPVAAPVPAASPEARRSLRFAWISVAVMPVAFVAAMVIGEGLLTMQGYESGSAESVPVGVALKAGIPAVLVLIAPAVTAMLFGFRARRRGASNGMIPAVIGIVVGGYCVLMNTLVLIFGK